MGWLNRHKKSMTPAKMRRLMNWYGPYVGAGVKIVSIADDWRSLQVVMRMRWFNVNAVGTHFGGSLYAMIDPHHMLLLMQLLGKGYVVWDQAAKIHFVKPGKGELKANIEIPGDRLNEIRAATANGEKYLPEFVVEVLDQSGDCVARATKTLYVRKKKPKS